MQQIVKIARKNGTFDKIVLENPQPAVLVGSSAEAYRSAELDSIADVVRKAGFDVARTAELWARSLYAVLGDIYLPSSEFGYAARGGAYIFGGDFVLVSEDVLKAANGASAVFEKLRKKIKFYALPHFVTGFTFADFDSLLGNKEQIANLLPSEMLCVYQDLDYVLGLVRSRNLLAVDSAYYKRNKGILEEICRKEGFEILALPKSEFRYYPANFLELMNGSNPKIVINGLSVQSIRNLERNGLEVVSHGLCLRALPFGVEDSGAVTCATNYVHDTFLLRYLGVRLAQD